MTRPLLSPLVLDGSEVKARLLAERSASEAPVHVDWLRFTIQRRHVLPSAEVLFPPAAGQSGNIWDAEPRMAKLHATLRELQGGDFAAAAQAWELGEQVAGTLGPDFVVHPEMRKGHDFYRHRWSIERAGQEVGWIGFLASGDSPRQKAQTRTIHVNLYGHACTFAVHGWRERMADLIDQHDGTVTRCDLALDWFDGMPGGILQVEADYEAGLMDVLGKTPKCNHVGDWSTRSEGGRSFYFGSKEAGKQTNVYEKGDQLFGTAECSPWMRIELRYGNKLRDLPTDMLRRPADFFAGASPWHASKLREFEASDWCAESIACRERLPVQTTDAEVSRVWRWLDNTASAAIAVAFKFAGDSFLDLVHARKLPGRLRMFKESEVSAAFQRRAERDKPVEGFCPALA
ncbi:replication initiation factor domain-containing protein [Pseudorhodoferax sp.]|uniref:replication initiation factor domain-containing protein n=1 Tax=Pseudorhodoferax sp. TaxID=1993553 RepID=UPI0039E5BD22